MDIADLTATVEQQARLIERQRLRLEAMASERKSLLGQIEAKNEALGLAEELLADLREQYDRQERILETTQDALRRAEGTTP